MPHGRHAAPRHVAARVPRVRRSGSGAGKGGARRATGGQGRSSGARLSGGRRVAERPASPVFGPATTLSAVMPVAILSAAWMVVSVGDVSESDANAAEQAGSPLRTSFAAQPLVGRHAAGPQRGELPVGATVLTAGASLPASGTTVGPSSGATAAPTSSPTSAPTSTQTAGTVDSTLTAAEAEAQCLEDGVSALDVAALSACVEDYLG